MVTRARDPGPLAREIDHTADVGLEIEAPTLGELLERAGLAMVGLMVDLAAVEPRDRLTLAVDVEELDELLHDWLQTLLVRFGTDEFVPCEIAIDTTGQTALRAHVAGERFDPTRHRLLTELKAVTWHQLAVRQHDAGWWARVIFDV